jgi:mannose-6-phosphate isomerase
LADAIEAGQCERCLHQIKPRAGDCIFLPAGTVHALGGGLLVAEIQQSSDTTYRLFDWNRVGADGQTRALHIQEALLVIDFDRGPVQPQPPQATDQPNIEQLVACDRFVLERIAVREPVTIGGDECFHVLAVLAGSIAISGDASATPLRQGESVLLPASLPKTILSSATGATVMHVYLP